jgi:hypothetical protein
MTWPVMKLGAYMARTWAVTTSAASPVSNPQPTTAKGDESMPLVVFASDSGRLLNMQLESRAKLSANLPPEQQALEQAELEATRAVAGAVGHTAFVLTVGDKGLHLTETAVLK